MLATFTVNSSLGAGADGDIEDGKCDTGNAESGFTGVCTLQAAIAQANAVPGLDNINFGIPGAGVPTIDLAGAMFVASPVNLDATTQPAGTVELRSASTSPISAFQLIIGSSGSTIRGFHFNSLAGGISTSTDGNLIVGNRFGFAPNGQASPITNTAIAIGGKNNVVGGTADEDRNVIGNSAIGITVVTPATGTLIRGNYIGTNLDATAAQRNSDSGVFVNFASRTTIEDNVIAASGTGIKIFGSTATDSVVRNNKIGTDLTGSVTDPDGLPLNGDEFGNGKGIFVNDAPRTVIENNVIAGSNGVGSDFGYGIQLANANASEAVIKGNMIGVDISGSKRLGNSSDGVLIAGASRVTVGGTRVEDRNVISGNGGDGVTVFGTELSNASDNVISGNYIGVDVTGQTDLGNAFRGVHIDQLSQGNTIGGTSSGSRNVISGNDSDGVIIALPTSTQNTVLGNYIGTTADGLSALGNSGSGVFIFESPKNLVGQSDGTRFVRNLIAANGEHGVRIQGEKAIENQVAGNLIGILEDGVSELPNATDGVLIEDAADNEIGKVFSQGPTHPNFPGNVIVAARAGVRVEGVDATGNQVLSNLIGVDANGTSATLSVALTGIHIIDGIRNYVGIAKVAESTPGGNTISNNRVGIQIETTEGDTGLDNIGNLIAGNFIGTDFDGNLSDPAIDLGNLDAGVLITNSSNNYIGGQPTGREELPGNIIAGGGGEGVRIEGSGKGNAIQRNQIFANDFLGIDLGNDGVTAGDLRDEDTGPNSLQNAPYVASVTRTDGKREIVGSLHSRPRTTFRIEFFSSTTLDASGFGEGQAFLGAVDDVPTDAEGNAIITFSPADLPETGFITATATDASGSTSEFSCGTPVSGVATDGHVFGVTNTNDAGSGSLRNAIEMANQLAGRDLIHFCFAGTGLQTIEPESPLPVVTDSVYIDGLSYGESSCNTNELATGSNANLMIELNGANAGPGAHGLNITGGNTEVRGFAIHGFKGTGIRIAQNGHNVISCNYIGTDVTGEVAMPNLEGGIKIADSPDNQIGGDDSASLNLISGNAEFGIRLTGENSDSNLVDGNLIGTNGTGTTALANIMGGVSIVDGSFNTIGGRGNVISGNAGDGITIQDSPASGPATVNAIYGNRIGTNASGTSSVANVRGVRILGANHNFVGGEDEDGNLISGNLDSGIVLADDADSNGVIGNLIGTDITGKQALPNGLDGVQIGSESDKNHIGGSFAETRNIISGNGKDGIRIGSASGRSDENLIFGNYIGTDIVGMQRLGNGGNGVFISGGKNAVGSSFEGTGNLISGNAQSGIVIDGANSTFNVVEGNLIGTDVNASLGDNPLEAPLRNLQHGVLINSASANRIGAVLDPASPCAPGTDTPANTIAGNLANGVRIEGVEATGNAITCNAIHHNGSSLGISGHGIVIADGIENPIRLNSTYENNGRGIDLGDDAITLNDVGDADGGANGFQDYPVAIGISLGILNRSSTWVLNSKPNTDYQIDFFSSHTPDPSGFGEGRFPFHTETLTTNANGNGTVTLTHSSFRSFISATATDPDGNTSEFSMIDTDGDALADAWETQGTDADGNGLIEEWELGWFDLNEDGTNDHVTETFLPGASPFHKDLFVEADTMAEAAMGPGLAQPTQEVLDVVANGRPGVDEGFAKVPNALVQNPDLKDGIDLHTIVDHNDIENDEFNGSGWAQFDTIKSNFFGTANERSDANSDQILAAKRLAYRYVVFGDRRVSNTISGVGELPKEHEIEYFGGNDFIVTLGGWNTRGGTAEQQQGTFMHELGHTLGLRHGGEDHRTYKPNYVSIMNYMWQTPKWYLNNQWFLDYSRVDFGILDESSLDETQGVITTLDGGDRAKAVALAAQLNLLLGGSTTRSAIWDQELDAALTEEIRNQALENLVVPMNGSVDWSRLKLGPFAGNSNKPNVIELGDLNNIPHSNDNSAATPPNSDDGLSIDVNGDGAITTLSGQEDWSRVRFYFLESEQGGQDGVHDELPHEEDFYDPEDDISMDFGDAPESYPTTRSEDGARHILTGPGNPLLGKRVDVEANGQHDALALGDDNSNGFDQSKDLTPNDPDDEDGVSFPSSLAPGLTSSVIVSVALRSPSDEGRLDAWIDFNADGDWNDAGEKIFDSVIVVNGQNELSLPVPSTAIVGTTFSRFRLSSAGNLTPVGVAADGEVEDHAVDIGEPTIDVEAISFTSDFVGAASNLTLSYKVHTEDSGPIELAFFQSESSHIGASAIEFGSRMTISDPALLAVGTHSITVNQDALEAALADTDTAYVLVAMDPNNTVSESDETNNASAFGGIHLSQGSVPAPLVIRLSEQADTLKIEQAASSVLIEANGVEHSYHSEDVSVITAITHGGDDQILLLASIPLHWNAGTGKDTLATIGVGQTLDLSALSSHRLVGVDVIDVVGSGSNTLILGSQTLMGMSDSSKVHLRHDEDDMIHYGSNWNVEVPVFEGGTAQHVLSDGNTQIQVENTRHWRNPLQSLDTDRDGFVSPIDVLLIINTLNRNGSRQLDTPTSSAELPDFYFDPSGDQFVSPIDVLLGVNFLNQGAGEAPEGESSSLEQSRLRLAPARIVGPMRIQNREMWSSHFDSVFGALDSDLINLASASANDLRQDINAMNRELLDGRRPLGWQAASRRGLVRWESADEMRFDELSEFGEDDALEPFWFEELALDIHLRSF